MADTEWEVTFGHVLPNTSLFPFYTVNRELFFVLLMEGTRDVDKTWQLDLAYRPNVDVCRQLRDKYLLD